MARQGHARQEGLLLGVIVLLLGIGVADAHPTAPTHLPAGEIIYSRLVDTDEKRGEGRAQALPMNGRDPRYQWQGFDLFLQTIPGGHTVRLTDHRQAQHLGAVMEDVGFDKAGDYAAFLAPRKPGTRHHGINAEQQCLWVINLVTRSMVTVPLPGTAYGYSWSPTGSRLIAIAGTGDSPRLFLYDAASRTVRPLFGTGIPHIGPWAWCGGREIIYEDTAAHLLLRRSVRTGRVTARWREPRGMTVVSLSPTPDGHRMLVGTGASFSLAAPHQPLGFAFRAGRSAGDSPLWEADDRRVLLHTFIDVPADDGHGSLPTETDHVIQAWDVRSRLWGPEILSWTDGVTPPWRYSLLSGPDAGGWLIVSEDQIRGIGGVTRLLAINLRGNGQRQLWATASPVLSLDWHEAMRSRSRSRRPKRDFSH